MKRILVVGAVAVLLGAWSLPGHAARAAAHPVHQRIVLADTPPNDNLPADCLPGSAGPPTQPDQLGLVIQIRGGSLRAGPVSVSGINADVCGVASVGPGTGDCPGTTQPVAATVNVLIPKDGQKFGSVSASIGIIPGLTPSVPFVPSAAPIQTSLTSCGTSVDGLQLNATAAITGGAGLFGISCDITVSPTLTGSVFGPLNQVQGTLTAQNFTIPTATPSATCPPGVATNLDAIVGLPLTTDSLTLPFTGYVYYLPIGQ